MDKSVLEDPNMNRAMKNQGVYNLGIAALLILTTFVFPAKWALVALLFYIVGVAAYGSFTVNKSIIVKQGGLAIIALITCLFLKWLLMDKTE